MVNVREVIERGDVAAFRELLDPDVVWVGVYPGQLCRDRDDVLAMLDLPLTAQRTVAPEILAERDGMLAVAVHADPPPEWAPDLHQVIVLQEGRVVEMRDYASRAEAVAAVESPW
jgi:ketosteroid isomerase-like protein